jgi:hypothetical protein
MSPRRWFPRLAGRPLRRPALILSVLLAGCVPVNDATDEGIDAGFELRVTGTVVGPPDSEHTTVVAYIDKAKSYRGTPRLNVQIAQLAPPTWYTVDFANETTRDTVTTIPVIVRIRATARPTDSDIVTLTAADGKNTQLAKFSIDVTEPPGYTLSTSVSTLSVMAGGQSLLLAVRANRAQNFVGAVTLSVSGLPAGLTTALPIRLLAATAAMTPVMMYFFMIGFIGLFACRLPCDRESAGLFNQGQDYFST